MHTVPLAVANSIFPGNEENLLTQMMEGHVGNGHVTKSVVKSVKCMSRAFIERRVLKALLHFAFPAAKIGRLLVSELDNDKYSDHVV